MKLINRTVYHNLINIRNASRVNKVFVELKYSKLFIYVLNFLYRKGYIAGYLFITLYRIRVFLKSYKDKGILSGLFFHLKRPNFTFKSIKYLSKSPYMLQYLYLFTTSRGFLTLEELFFKGLNIGGILYFYIVLK